MTEATSEAMLTTLNEAYIQAVQTLDVAWFTQHLAKDFLSTGADGTLAGRAAFLARATAPAGVSWLRCEDVRIRLFGDTAIIHAATVHARADSTPGRGRYTGIWVRHGERWLCAAAHVTRG